MDTVHLLFFANNSGTLHLVGCFNNMDKLYAARNNVMQKINVSKRQFIIKTNIEINKSILLEKI